MAKTNKIHWDIKQSIISAIVGILIGSIISIMSIFINQHYQKKQKEQEFRISIFNKRIDLIDRTSKIFYQLPGLEEQFNYHFTKNIDTLRDPKSKAIILVPKNIQLSKELAIAKGEFFSSLNQSQLFFGPSTQKSIDKLLKFNNSDSSSWWETPNSLCSDVLNSMHEELNYW